MSKQQTILIIEDNGYNLNIAKELLEMAGYRILEAQDADTGIHLAREHHPDLILMDMYLPVKDGYETTQVIKADPGTRDIPIVAFTALAMNEDRKRAEAVGCAGMISKPIVVDTFAQTVSSYLNHQQPNGPFISEAGEARAFSATEPESREIFLKLSHNLQAPLRKIQQCCGFIRNSGPEELSEENRKFVEMINRAAEQMFQELGKTLADLREKAKH